MRNKKLRKLCAEICKNAFHWTPPKKINLRFKHMRRDLGWVVPYGNPHGSKGSKMRLDENIKFSRVLVGACLVHEIAHLVSGSARHDEKFYRVFFKAAQTKYGRQFF